MPNPRCLLVLIAAAGLVGAACGKKTSSKPARPWPKRATQVWKEKVRDVSFEITLPKGLGVFRDPNAVIWRVDNLGQGPLVTVARVRRPKSVSDATEDAILGDHDKFARAKPTSDGYWVVAEDKRHQTVKVYRWITRGNRTVKCWAYFFWRGETPRDVRSHNALLERICRSVKITG